MTMMYQDKKKTTVSTHKKPGTLSKPQKWPNILYTLRDFYCFTNDSIVVVVVVGGGLVAKLCPSLAIGL